MKTVKKKKLTDDSEFSQRDSISGSKCNFLLWQKGCLS